jgi:hypothetical protein
MIFSFTKFGRLGNRLFLFSHLIALSDYFKTPLYNLGFTEYSKYFGYFKNNRYCAYGIPDGGKVSIIAKAWILGKTGLIPTVKFWDDKDIVFDEGVDVDSRIKLLVQTPLAIFEGWRLRSHTHLGQIKKKIQEIFKPNESIVKCVADRIQKMDEMAEVKVGIHIRWEDFRNTEYYFPLDAFLKRMDEIKNLLSPKKVAFFVCSPEKLDPTLLPQNSIFYPDSSPVCDLYTLARCDYIIGPPSTFSGWASFYGEKPIFTMQANQKIDDPSAYKIWNG